MKFTKLCEVALVATIGAATVGAASVSADANVAVSNGTLEVTGGTLTPGEITDPEKPGEPGITPETPCVVVNPEVGSKGILAVTNLNFESVTVGTTSKNATAITLPGGAGTRGNFVSFGDKSGTYTGYKITGKLTSQFTNGTTTLDGASIAYTNPILATSGTGTISGQTMTQTLSVEGGEQTFITAATGEGSGIWTMEFGQSSAYAGEGGAAGTDASSVNLAIPASVASAMTTGTYTATVTWTMGATA